jgi:aldehyde dehydrogenase (NAD+)
MGDGAEVVPALLKAHSWNHVFFTGSTVVGQKIYALAAEKLTPVTLELGGKSPCIVAADASLKVAARRIVFGKMINAGQTCVAPDYLLVHHSIKQALLKEITAAVQAMYGPDLQASGEYGRIVNDRQYQRLKAYLSQGQLIYGGDTNDAQRFMGLALLDQVAESAPVMQEEIFGPVLPVFSYDSTEEAMAFVRRHPHPLSLYLFTEDKALQAAWARQVSFGGGCFNNTLLHLSNEHLPFGGVGPSGMGSYHGQKSFDTFSHLKSILSTPTWFDPALKYPPFKGRLGLLKRLMR